jgi:1-acyl-sn-glycerol-3-phosphate acyltransferase
MQRGVLERLNYLQRLVGTGLGFGFFGLGGMAIGLVFFPLICLRHRGESERRRAARLLIHRVFALHLNFLRWVGVMDYRVSGLESLRASRGELIVANHPTLLDVVFLISQLPDADCIVRNGLWNNPFTRGPVRAAGYLLNDGSPALIERCAERLRSGASLVVFPEGTRTVRGATLNPLQRGAANIAARSGAPCRPVIIRCDPLTLTKHEKWYRIPPRRFFLSMEVRDALPVASIVGASAGPAIAARRINAALQAYFMEELRVASPADRAGMGSGS